MNERQNFGIDPINRYDRKVSDFNRLTAYSISVSQKCSDALRAKLIVMPTMVGFLRDRTKSNAAAAKCVALHLPSAQKYV